MVASRVVRLWLAGLAAIFGFLLCVRMGQAAPRATKFVVLAVGKGATSTATALETELSSSYAVGSAEELHHKPRTDSGRPSLRTALASSVEEAPPDIRRAAREHGVRGVVLVDLLRATSQEVARVILIDARDDGAIMEGQAVVPLHTNAATIASRLRATLDPMLRSMAGPDEAAGTVTPVAPSPPTRASTLELGGHGEPRDVVTSGAPPPPRDYAHALVLASPHVGVGTRHFDYTQRLSTGLRSYGLTAAPIVGIGGEVYPFVLTDSELAAAFGVVGEYAHSIGVDSALPDGSTVNSSWANADIAVRARLPVTARVLLGARAGYGNTTFSYGGVDAALSAQLPSVAYGYLRFGADGRVEVWRLALYANLDYLSVQEAGAVAGRFPHASVGGIDAGVGVGVAFLGHFEARTGVIYQRFFYDFRSQPADARIAGGAADDLGRWDTSVAFYY
jgi:hypothetical protein